jgi:signal transduction histidine kinase/CheY-like chemotaxis protein
VENPVTRVLAEGAIVGLANHTTLIARDGSESPIDDSGAPIRNREGRIVGVVLVFRDVSERQAIETERQAATLERERLLEAERVARSEAEKANRIKDDFVAMVSHELRTPLTAILGWTELLLETQKDPEALRGLEVIGRNTRVQTQLISDLLDISRIVSGKLLLEVQSVDLVSVIELATDTVRLAASARGITIRKRLDTRAAAMVGDPARLQQVIWNLLSNAIKFTSRGGTIEIEMRPVSSRVEIAISDNGIGIRPELIDRVFERFHQQEGPTTRRHGGLGLGLAIVKHLVELHGGTVWAESEGEGKGAKFTISLPIAFARPARDEMPRDIAAESDGRSLAGLRFLVVEDEPDTRDIVRRLVESRGAEVDVAASADEALRFVRERRPDILVSDIGLPDVDGYEFIRRVRSLGIAGIENMPAVALTAFARSEDRTRALVAGYQVHIAKPVDPAELVATLASLARLIQSNRDSREPEDRT